MQLPNNVQNILAYGQGYTDGMKDGHICGFHDALVCTIHDLTALLKKYAELEKEWAASQEKAKRERLETMPQFEKPAEQKLGHWIEPDSETIGKYRDDGCVAYYTCSCCKEISKTDYDFCPNCGARMDATDTNVGRKGGADNG